MSKGSDLRLRAALWIAAPILAASLRLFGFERTRDVLARLVPARRKPRPPEAEGRADRIAALVAAVPGSGALGVRCLARSLLTWAALRYHGIPAEIRVGVRREAGALRGHAWVECGGRPLTAPGDGPTFAAFERDFASAAGGVRRT